MTNRIVYTPRTTSSRAKKFFSFRVWFFAVVLFLLLGGVSVGVLSGLRLSHWQIQKLSFSGLEVLKEEEIEDEIRRALSGTYFFLIPQSSLFVAHTEALAENLLNKFPRIEDVTVTKKFPDTLEVSIVEKKLFGIFCGRETCAYIDRSGFAYETAPHASGALILKIKSDAPGGIAGQHVVDRQLIERMVFLSEKMQQDLGVVAVGYELVSNVPREIRAETNQGFKIFFNRDDDFENVFRVIKKVLTEEIKDKISKLEYIDARFGNKVFYKMKK